VAIAVECPSCGKQMRVKDELAGRKGKCPQCQTMIQIPSAGPVPIVATQGAAKAATSTETVKAPAAKTVAVATGVRGQETGDRRQGTAAVAEPAAPVAVKAAPLSYEQIKETVLAAFNGKMEPPKVGLFRKLGALLVALILLVMPVFYLAVMGAVGYGMYWLAVSGILAGQHPAVFWAAEAGLGLFLLCLIKPLIEPQRRGERVYAVDAPQEPLLTELTAKICEQIGARPPKRIELECSTRLVAAKSGSVLTIGLPAMASLSVEQFAAVAADRLAHNRAGAAGGLMSLIRGINYWLWRSVYGKGRLDRWLSLVAQRRHFHLAKLLLPLMLMRLPAQLVLFIPMFIANTIAATVVRAAEFDADRAAARLVGRKTFTAVVERLEQIDFVWDGMLMDLKFLSKEGQLPENLPQQIAVRMQDMTAELCAALRETVHAPDEKPFETRPSTPDRFEAVQNEPEGGIFRCGLAARGLLREYEALSRQMSGDFYAGRFGVKAE
jgi:hypothetical protein